MDFPGHFQQIFQQLNHQRLHAQLCDCVVLVGGQRFQAHRSILAACSSHFRALLSSGDSDEPAGPGADKGRGGCPGLMELDPEVVTPEAFSTLLDMIYTSTLSLGASNVMDVLLAASHLHLNAVVKACKIHLSRRNFPASPPKGWRSVQQQQQQQRSSLLQQVTSALEEDLTEEAAGLEVSQSSGAKDERLRVSNSDQGPGASSGHKRKSTIEQPGSRKRSCMLPAECYHSPTVTRSSVSAEDGAEELLSPDCLKTTGNLWESRGEQEEDEEEKYEVTKGESEEIQLPSQSDSSTGGAGAWEAGRDTVVKVKVGDEGEEEGVEQKAATIEVKRENLSSCSPDLTALTRPPPPSPQLDSSERLDAQLNGEKPAAACATDGDIGALQPQLCSDLHADTGTEAGDVGEESMDGDGLDSLSELAFSCFLNPSHESVMGALEEEQSLATLTAAAATASIAPAAATDAGQLCRNPEEVSASSESSSSLVFPVTSVPLQQLLPSQSPAFSDTLILQPAQSSIAELLSGVRPGFSLEASVVQAGQAGKSRGSGGLVGTTFRRIAPKVPPGSEAGADPTTSSGSAGDDRPPLTRASEEVLSKCKKAAAEDHVLLVEGEKKYACKICCKTFMNLTDCKKHIRVHTGEKPYPCPKCGKRFSQSSHLYKHSKNSTCLNWKDDQSFPDTLI